MKKLILLCCLAGTANAENFTPSNMAELNEAINTSMLNSEDDTITLGASTYTGTIVFPTIANNDKITLLGAGRTETIIDADQDLIVDTMSANKWEVAYNYQPLLVIENMTFTNGYVPFYENFEDNVTAAELLMFQVSMTNVDVTNNSSSYGIFSTFSIVLDNVNASNNKTTRNFGTFSAEMIVDIKDSTFTDNTAGASGAAFTNNCMPYGDKTEMWTNVVNSTFTNNVATGHSRSTSLGGAIRQYPDCSLSITGSTFDGNKGLKGSGGAIRTAAMTTISNTSFTNNSAMGTNVEYCMTIDTAERQFCQGDGGAIFFHDYYGNTLTVTDSEFTNNSAYGVGGAISMEGTCTAANGYPNTSSDATCPVYAGQEILADHTMTDVIFDQNTAGAFDSGAIYTSEGSLLGSTKYTYGDISFVGVSFIGNDVYSTSGVLDVEVTEAVSVSIATVANVNMGSSDITLDVTITGTPTTTIWEQTGGTTNALVDGVFSVPASVSANETFTYTVTVSDEYTTATVEVSITVLYVAPPVVVTPPEKSSGGSTSVIIITLLMLITIRRLTA
jgi:predicted outer membrane repeat protein